MSVVVLAGGSGGAKLARGLLDVVGDDLTVVANTGDDVEVYGAYVSPDPDLVTLWLCDRIEARGWGVAGDSFTVMEELRSLGVDVWFSLGDRDLAHCIERARRLSAGERLTEAQLALGQALGVTVPVLPMCDEPVRTRVEARGAWWAFQEFMIRLGGAATDFRGIEGVEFSGIEQARPTPEVTAAIEDAEIVILGPSNPVISVGPILAVPGLREALRATRAPVVAMSPVVGGRSLKGPTEGFLEWAGLPVNAAGVAEYYGDVLDGMVADEQDAGGLPVLAADTMLDTPERRRACAQTVLDFARALS